MYKKIAILVLLMSISFAQEKIGVVYTERIVLEYEEFKDIISSGGFVCCGWDGTTETENIIKNETKATIRCIPFNKSLSNIKCIRTGNDAPHEVIFAKAY